MATSRALWLALAVALAACADAPEERASGPAELIGLSEAETLSRFGAPDRRRTGEGGAILFYEAARFDALRGGDAPTIRGGSQGMDASLTCYRALTVRDGAVVAVDSVGGC
ncbi:MAG: hypothetical protein NXI21_06615 [Alphaproteobacteria bacterium]|nr:hypothetical protein [Alphaproteobacteria bacterium]